MRQKMSFSIRYILYAELPYLNCKCSKLNKKYFDYRTVIRTDVQGILWTVYCRWRCQVQFFMDLWLFNLFMKTISLGGRLHFI